MIAKLYKQMDVVQKKKKKKKSFTHSHLSK